MSGVLVFGQTIDGTLAPVTLEAVSAGMSIASSINEPLSGALIGGALSGAISQFHGITKLYVAEGPHLTHYTAQAFLEAALQIIEASSPAIVLFPHTLETREWAPRLAARMDTGLAMDCIALAAEEHNLVVHKPVYGGGVLGEFVVRGSPCMATLRAGMFEATLSTAVPEAVRIDVKPPAETGVTYIDETTAIAGGGPKLKDAKVIVSGGRGVGGKNNWHFIESTAAALDAAVGCSRPVADSGWVPSSHQVGLSGTLVSPDLYLAVGISGAVQHLAGISAAKTVIAINNDQEADIFTRADYGVVDDFQEVLPAFAERIKQLRA